MIIILSALKYIFIYNSAIYHHSKCRMNLNFPTKKEA